MTEARKLTYISTTPRPPKPLLAVLLTVPGAACWCLLGAVILSLARHRSPWGVIPQSVAMFLWLFAVLAGITAVGHYWRLPKPWYVMACLIINIAALVLTSVALIYFGAAR